MAQNRFRVIFRFANSKVSFLECARIGAILKDREWVFLFSHVFPNKQNLLRKKQKQFIKIFKFHYKRWKKSGFFGIFRVTFCQNLGKRRIGALRGIDFLFFFFFSKKISAQKISKIIYFVSRILRDGTNRLKRGKSAFESFPILDKEDYS